MEAGQNTRQAMQLYAALGLSLLFTAGAVLAAGTALTKALAIAESLNDTDYRLRLLWGLWADRLNNGEFRATLTLAKQFREIAVSSPDPNDIPIGDRLIGFSLHFLGDQAGARRHIETMLNHYVPPDRGMHVVRFQFDQRVMARVGLARILWLLGFPDQAMHTANEIVDDALSMNHEISLCNALIQAACPLALLTGDLDAAAAYITMLVRHAESRALDVWRRCGDCFNGQLLIARGDLLDGLRILDSAIGELTTARFTQYHGGFLATLANGLAQAGRLEEGIAVIDKALARADRADERWSMAELLRTRGELLCRANGADAVMLAEAQLQESLDLARRQGALSWELRGAMSVARLLLDQGRSADGIALLQPIYNRFTEGAAPAGPGVDVMTDATLRDYTDPASGWGAPEDAGRALGERGIPTRGAPAVACRGTARRCTTVFFGAHTRAERPRWSGFEPKMRGWLPHPMTYGPATRDRVRDQCLPLDLRRNSHPRLPPGRDVRIQD